jgi:hypothetical protein
VWSKYILRTEARARRVSVDSMHRKNPAAARCPPKRLSRYAPKGHVTCHVRSPVGRPIEMRGLLVYIHDTGLLVRGLRFRLQSHTGLKPPKPIVISLNASEAVQIRRASVTNTPRTVAPEGPHCRSVQLSSRFGQPQKVGVIANTDLLTVGNIANSVQCPDFP